jgi:putative PIN family toxin of toxin-antitoxin system
MHSKKLRIVLDTNVLYAGFYSSKGASFKILEAVAEGKLQIVMSVTLLFEYEDILKRNRVELGLSDMEIERILDYLCMQSLHQEIYFLWRPFLPDPKDDHLLELAVASRTRLIITHNTKDFRGLEKFDIRTMTPKRLLEVIS